jgi:hypothetical protein
MRVRMRVTFRSPVKRSRDAALPPVTRDGALPPECEGGTPPRSQDAAPPSEDCMPACLWEIVKDCPPPAACEQPRPGRREVYKGCDFNQGRCQASVEVYMGDRLCYTFTFTEPPARAPTFGVVRSADGRQVPLMMDVWSNSTTTLCEPCVYRGPAFSVPEFLLCDGGYPTESRLDRSRPECLP